MCSGFLLLLYINLVGFLLLLRNYLIVYKLDIWGGGNKKKINFDDVVSNNNVWFF